MKNLIKNLVCTLLFIGLIVLSVGVADAAMAFMLMFIVWLVLPVSETTTTVEEVVEG